jgi:hypothetical protein
LEMKKFELGNCESALSETCKTKISPIGNFE